ncbi:DsbA family protein [Bradyrhizobium sp. 83012]|uniref:DsbA family protein n=1 Tax=Bradyrhizobium aeschynomenes TaxID=2734909 RepID=A0ABX2CE75_9BRAD|nr:DsbA family protein [Bradyrhizobium aeschynomenes]NPU65765.1 DsbA family protein [Bradyrhizobium aeschynomenes]NPV23635.1 DsbA family protein [Bradyrhizobium aeschynomenes]
MRLTYLFDPLCGWCYGAGPAIEKLAAVDDIALELLPTGLFAGRGAGRMDAQFAEYAWSNDQRIAKLTGQRFSDDYRKRILGAGGAFDSTAASLGLTAVHITDPGREITALKELQLARYVQGQDIVSIAGVGEILLSLGLAAAAERMLKRDHSLVETHGRRIQTAQSLMRRHGLSGVPSLLAGDDADQRSLPGSVLYEPIDGLLAQLRAG